MYGFIIWILLKRFEAVTLCVWTARKYKKTKHVIYFGVKYDLNMLL